MIITAFPHQFDDFVLTHNESEAGCHGSYCYKQDITYDATIDQIELVKEQSLYCEQEVDFECYYVALTGLSGWIGVRKGYILTMKPISDNLNF